MQQVTFTDFRDKAGHWLDKIEADGTPIRITRRRHGSAVLMTKRDYDEMMERLKQ